MSELETQDVHESPDQRMQRRRARRWKRRARIVGPLLSIPLLLATLALSVDLIEYQPQPPKPRLVDRPIPAEVLEKQRARENSTGAPLSSTASVVSSPILGTDTASALGRNGSHLDLRLGAEDSAPSMRDSSAGKYAAPESSMPPYAPRERR
jgi:hypothetical protein